MENSSVSSRLRTALFNHDEENSSHSKDDSEDSELENIMGHHPPREGHPFPHHGQPGVDSESEGHESPRTPGTPTFLRPPVGRKAPKELEHDPRHAVQRGLVDYNLQSPISPSRPKSPWGRFDPYDSSEVMPGNQELALTQREAE